MISEAHDCIEHIGLCGVSERSEEIWETEVQRGFLLMPVMRSERNEVSTAEV